jgi:hypothetical protein
LKLAGNSINHQLCDGRESFTFAAIVVLEN